MPSIISWILASCLYGLPIPEAAAKMFRWVAVFRQNAALFFEANTEAGATQMDKKENGKAADTPHLNISSLYNYIILSW